MAKVIQRRSQLLVRVRDYMNRKWAEHAPEIKAEEIIQCDGKPAVHYMNGNDGTGFDWAMNDRVCEFYYFYKSTEYGFIKVFVNRKGTINGYLYKEQGHGEPIKLEEETFGETLGQGKGDAKTLRDYLANNFDAKNIYDEPIHFAPNI